MDRDQMLIVHENMFGSKSGLNSEGHYISPLDVIDVEVLSIQEEWLTLSTDHPEFPGSRRALYNVVIYFLDTSSHIFSTHSQLFFYAKQIGDYWYLSGIKPKPFDSTTKGMEEASYDSVLYLYHLEPTTLIN